MRKTVGLLPAQSAFRKSEALYRGFCAGRSSGKTLCGAYDLIRRAKRGRTYLVASPTAVLMGDTTFPTVKRIARALGVWDANSLRLSPYPTVTLTTGAEIRFRTAEDPEKLRGPNLSGVWLDEASLMRKEAYDIVIACLREAGQQGWASATFTPKGVAHWTYSVFGTDRPDVFCVHMHTRDNRFNPPDFAETLQRQYGDGSIADQELAGKFLDDDVMNVIPASWVRLAQARWRPGPPEGVRLSALGVDVARGGKDKTVIAKRYGNWFAPLLKYPGSRTPDGDSVAILVQSALENTSALVNIDAVGVGSSPYDCCRRLLRGARIMPVLSGNGCDATDKAGILRFINIRAFLYWSMRELLDPANKVNVALPPDPELLADLSAPTWSMTASGIKVEPKPDIIKRLGRSPDCSDAIVYSILLPLGG